MRDNQIKGYQTGPSRQLERVFVGALSIIILTAGFSDYWSYSKTFHSEPGIYYDVLAGTAKAPNQYRVGIVKVADFLARHSHLALRHTFTFVDIFAAFTAIFSLFQVLRTSRAFREATVEEKWFAATAFTLLVQFYLGWITWYQRPETLPSTATISIVLLLLTREHAALSKKYLVAAELSLVLLSALQGFVRADVALALNLGIVLFSLTRLRVDSRFPRGFAAAAVFSGIVVIGVQLFLIKVAYPHANYGDTPAFQLWLNLKEHGELIAFGLFMPVYVWTALAYIRKRAVSSAGNMALLLGSGVFLGMWVLLGRIEEVRIFMPFALALAPLSVETALQLLLAPSRDLGDADSRL